MIKKYMADLAVFVFLGLLIPLFVVKKPVISYNVPQAKELPAGAEKQEQNAADKASQKKQQAGVYAKLEARNLFSKDGAYKAAKDKVVLPENPYRLIGVLGSKEKQAVFRDYTGQITTLKKGDKLMDDFIVKDIEGLYVRLKKGKEEKELRIFSLPDKDKKV